MKQATQADRRAAPRKRVLFGAVAATPCDGRRYDCLVKNWSDLGARIEFPQPLKLVEDIALTVTHTGQTYRARIAWMDGKVAGVAFTSAPASTYIPDTALDKQIRDTKETVRLLNKVVDRALGRL